MKSLSKIVAIAFAFLFFLGLWAVSFASEKGKIKTTDGWAYQVKLGHAGGDVTPTEAMKMTLEDEKHTFIVDVRTRPEYNYIGHPTMAYNVPVNFWTGKMDEKGGEVWYQLQENTDFGKNLLMRFNPETDSLIFMCRSGERSCQAVQQAIKAGFKPEKLFNMLGGFEGDKVKNKFSAFNGQRKLGGWRNEGLPWTYNLDKNLAYDTFKSKP